MPGTILVVSHTHDPHAMRVLTALEQRGRPAILFDTGRLPRETRLSVTHDPDAGWGAAARFDGRTLDMADVRAVWWRRPQPFALHAEIGTAEDRGFALGETHAAAYGLWSCLDAAWINDPDRDDKAGRKLWQLKVARECGLRVPRTCATNDPDAARAFIAAEAPARVIYKTFSATERTWRETRVLKPEEADLLDSVRYAPIIFQEYVVAAVDLRVTVIDGQVFAAEIHSQATEYVHDFRMAMHQAEIAAHTLPGDVLDGLARLMTATGLVYGAIDLRLTPAGEYVFLEINPAGQWLFVEERTQQPIAAALADALIARTEA